jgi:hypothetical protein
MPTKVLVSDAGIEILLGSANGPVGRLLRKKTQAVVDRARANVQGPFLNVRTGDLLRGIGARFEETPGGRHLVRIGSDAVHNNFAYPGFLNQQPRHAWLTDALGAFNEIV